MTAGGTREPIDAVRFIGNRSSGRMGFALAEEAAGRGAEVTVVAANVTLPRHQAVRYVEVETAAELAAATKSEFGHADVLLMAAAVADYRPAAGRADKIKKSEQPELELRLERTEDVLSSLAARRRDGQLIVGFAAETGRTRSSTAATSSRARRSTPSSSTTCRDRGSASTPPTTRSRSSPPRRSGTCRVPPRPRSRPPSWTPS